MNQVFARNVLRFCLKSKRNLLNCIKELGSQETDDEFVLGLRDCHGTATSSLEIFDLTMVTMSNTHVDGIDLTSSYLLRHKASVTPLDIYINQYNQAVVF